MRVAPGRRTRSEGRGGETMSDNDAGHEVIERLEWSEPKQDPTPESRLRAFSRRTALTGTAAGVAALVLDACGGSSNNSSSTSKAAAGTPASGVFGEQSKFK